MIRGESHYEVNESGKVKLVTTDSPISRAAESTEAIPYSPTLLSPVRTLLGGSANEEDNDERSETPNEYGDQMEKILSIAQPLKQHGSVFLGKQLPGADASADAATISPSPQHFRDESFEAAVTPEALTTTKPRSYTSIQTFLCTVPHLCTLTIDQISALRVMVREYDALDNVIEPGTTLQHVYVLASGTVEVFDLRNHNRAITHKRIASITAPNMFGIESLVFDNPSEFSFSASSNNTTILLIGKAQFMELFKKSNVFAHSVGSRMTVSMPQFNTFQDFCRAVFAMSSVVSDVTSSVVGQSEGYTLHLPAIIEAYSKIGTVIHRQLHKAEIDINALHYACARLPANITETFVINLARSLPPFLASELRNRHQSNDCPGGVSFSSLKDAMGQPSPSKNPNANVTFVATSNRRRSAWRIGDKGHTLVLMRDGFTDVVDFMTAFCIHVIEARKLRIRLQSMISPRAPDVLNDAIALMRENNLSNEEVVELQRHILGQLPLTSVERAGLVNMWPHSAIQKLYHIVMHQEQYIVRIDTSLSKRFGLDPYFQWALKIRSQINKILKRTDSDSLPENVTISILSSRNRSTKNLLCSLVETHMAETKSYNDQAPDISSLNFTNERDRWYYTMFRMINEQSELREEYKETLRDCGFSTFEDHTSSGLQVDLIDVSRLKLQLVDPYLRDAVVDCMAAKTRKFILNIDFTFGVQVEGVMRALFLMFGHNITSVNVVGKCAGISGSRGDVLLPKKLVFSKAALGEDTTDEIRDCGNPDLSAKTIQSLIGDTRHVFEGSCITIPGMILQNAVLIKFYKVVYQADGMEMEGSYIARQIEECGNLQLLRTNLITRYVFYMSDMPCGNEDGSKINARTKSAECITTMYASLRATLKAILTAPSP